MYLFIIHFISMTIVINEIYTFSYSHSEIKHDYEIIITCLIYELK